MRALCWFGTEDVRMETVPDPTILDPRDVILKITSTAICGSDLHLYGGYMPTMQRGDILGHEFMGEVVEKGAAVTTLSLGDRVVVPFTITCGRCHYCTSGQGSLCDNSNPNAWMAEKAFGYSSAALYGYSHMLGGYAGGQAEYVRVPYADSGPLKVPAGLPDDKVLFLSDILPTGYQAAKNCDIKKGDVVAVWGAGPVGLFAIQSALLLGAERVIAIDLVPERLRRAKQLGNGQIDVLDYEDDNILEAVHELSGGRGPDACIEAVGMEAHGVGLSGWYDKAKQSMMLETDRPTALRQAIMACGKGGTVSIPGVFGGFIDKMPMGAAFNKSLTLKMGQTHVPTFMPELLERIERGEIDPTFVISHELPLEEAPNAYRMFRDKQDGCTKVVLKPH